MPESMTVVTSTPETMTEQNSTPAAMATANAQTITIIGGDQYPVSSVNGKTGAVVLDADDVGAVATETGKGLSTNDYTDADKEKVDNAVQADEFDYQYTKILTTPATITDSNGMKILNAVITGNSTQDGTPTPTAPIDIENTGSTLKLTSCGKNLLPYPYYHTTKTTNGITFTDNGDGTITANGTATASAYFTVYSVDTAKYNGRYFLSGCPSGGSITIYNQQIKVGTSWLTDSGNGVSVNGAITNLVIVIASGTTVSNKIFKPQLEIGTTATSYEPYSCSTYTIPLTDTAGTTHTMRKYDVVKKHDDGKWYFDCNSAYVASYDSTVNADITSNNMIRSTTGSLTAGAGVLYRTATATSYELSESTSAILDSIALQKGNANIYFTNAVAPVMTADYAQNLKLYCSTLEARIEALENIQ